ncbi:carbohydrate porin [Zymomonas mobilis]|uniref:carbohydrate porin n=1 Tax=Zymomonas mobilis TaxID=542 RepID=UPI0021AB764C|nr:carbohydrate porin [Zymomonas mobilis]
MGGIRHGSAYSAQLMMGLDLDTDRLVGMKGGTIRFYVTNRHGQNLANTAIGNNTSVQEIWGTQTPIWLNLRGTKNYLITIRIGRR